MATPVGKRASPVCKVTLPDQRRAKIFDFTKPQGNQFGMERVGFKVAPEGLSHGRDSRGKRPSGGGVFILVQARSRGITVVEHNVVPPGKSAM